MAKNRNKTKKNGAVSMDISVLTVSDLTQEYVAQKPAASGVPTGKVKGRPMKRSKNVRMMKAVAKAISKNEKSVEKVLKRESKTARTQSAKVLYD